MQAGIGQTNLSGVDLKGKDTVSFDFYDKDDAKSKGELTIKASIQTENPEGEWKDVILPSQKHSIPVLYHLQNHTVY